MHFIQVSQSKQFQFFFQLMKIALHYKCAKGFSLVLSNSTKKSKNILKNFLKKFGGLLFLYSQDGSH